MKNEILNMIDNVTFFPRVLMGRQLTRSEMNRAGVRGPPVEKLLGTYHYIPDGEGYQVNITQGRHTKHGHLRIEKEKFYDANGKIIYTRNPNAGFV